MRGVEEDEPAQSPARARPGSLGKYELCAKLDSGGQAEVYLALMRGQAGFNKLVVIKKLRSVAVDDPIQVSMFLNEARLAARLNHPNIVHTYEVGDEGGEYFIAMEYLEGQPMNRLTHHPIARQTFTPAMWAKIASEALRGLGYAHNLTDYDGTPLEIVHRDISPDNLFLTYDGEVKVVDFGVAKALLNHGKTETGTLKGKVSYMAPEQVRGTTDRRADLFGMGTVLWEFLTGKRLFEGERASVLYRLMTDPIPTLASEMPDVDPWLGAIVDRALAKDPNQRFQTAEEMREALEEFIRTSGDLIPDVHFGRVVREAFGETRQRVQRQVQAAMSRAVPRATGEEPVISALPSLSSMQSLNSLSGLPEIASVTPSQPVFSPWHGRPTGSTPSAAVRQPTMSGLSDAVSAPIQTRNLRTALLATAGVAALAVVVALFVALRTKHAPVAAPTQLAPVEITSDPPGARVEMNGKVLGQTPGRFELTPGPHTLTVALDAYKPETLEVEATSSPTSRAVQLRPSAGAAVPRAEAAKTNEAVKTDEAATADETAKTTDRAVVLEPIEPQRAPQQRPAQQRAVVQHPPPARVRTPPPAPVKAKETAAPAPVVTSPRVKVIEEDPKRKIDVIPE